MSNWSWLNEGAESAPVTRSDLEQLEAYADRLFGKVGIDVEFTQHFLDRVNDQRNQRQITLAELTRLFKQEFKKWGKKIAQLGPDAQAVMKDMKTDVNMPFVLVWDANNQELDLIAKTVMRKDNFKTSNPEFAIEDAGAAADLAGLFGQFNLEEIKQLAIVLGVSIPVLKTMFYTVSGINKIKRALKNIGKKKTPKTKGIFAEVAGVGIIDAQNTTADVKPGETQRQAAKLGIKLNKDNEPPLLHARATKNSQDTNKVAQLTERWKQISEIEIDNRIEKNFLYRGDYDNFIGKTKKVSTIKGYDIHYIKKDREGVEFFLIKDPDSEGFLGALMLTNYLDKYWKSSVFFDPEIQGKGIALPLYVYAIKQGYTLVSDHIQSKGSKEGIWKKLANVPGVFVYAWDKNNDQFFQWNPDEDNDSEIYYDEDKLDQLQRDFENGKISNADYAKGMEELKQLNRSSDVRLVAIADKKNVKESAVLVQQYNTKNLMNFLKKLTNEPVDQQLKKAIRKELTKRGIDLTEVEQIDVEKDDMGISPDLFQDALDGSGAELTGDSVKNYAVAKGKHGNTIYYFLLDDNKPFGMLKLVGAPGRGKMSMAMMLPEYQGQGVMPELYKVAIQDVGVIKSDVEQSAGGTAVWKKLAQDPDLTVYAYDEKSDEYAMVDDNLDSKFSTLNRAQDIKDLEAEETKELAHLLDLQLSGEIDREEYKRRVSDLRKAYEKEIVDAQDPGSVYFVATMKESTLDENFADGKVKGKSRPGRFKKAGVSCKGSVTSLRKKAKNSSGEKQKGYHWCANMKSGRKKK